MRALVTGSNRGIGLEYARQLVARGDQVFAACRPSSARGGLEALQAEAGDRLAIVPMDVTDPASVRAAYETVSAGVDGLDLVINNAAINPGQEALADLTPATMIDAFTVNVVGVMLVIQQFVPLLKRGVDPKVINISSGAGSLTYGRSGMYSYRVSKAALNMFNRTVYQELKPLGIISIVLHPGHVLTDMGGPHAPLRAEDSVRQQLAVIDGLTLDDTGSYKDYAGKEIPW